MIPLDGTMREALGRPLIAVATSLLLIDVLERCHAPEWGWFIGGGAAVVLTHFAGHVIFAAKPRDYVASAQGAAIAQAIFRPGMSGPPPGPDAYTAPEVLAARRAAHEGFVCQACKRSQGAGAGFGPEDALSIGWRYGASGEWTCPDCNSDSPG